MQQNKSMKQRSRNNSRPKSGTKIIANGQTEKTDLFQLSPEKPQHEPQADYYQEIPFKNAICTIISLPNTEKPISYQYDYSQVEEKRKVQRNNFPQILMATKYNCFSDFFLGGSKETNVRTLINLMIIFRLS